MPRSDHRRLLTESARDGYSPDTDLPACGAGVVVCSAVVVRPGNQEVSASGTPSWEAQVGIPYEVCRMLFALSFPAGVPA